MINLYTVVKHIRWEISNIFICFLFCKSLSWSLPIIIRPVQVPRWDMPRWLTWSIILLNLPPQSQIIVPRPISEKNFYSAHKETLWFMANCWSSLNSNIFMRVLQSVTKIMRLAPPAPLFDVSGSLLGHSMSQLFQTWCYIEPEEDKF